MKSGLPADTLVPSGVLAEVQAAAAEEHRAPGDLIREAVLCSLEQRRVRRSTSAEARRRSADAAAPILDLRKRNILPPGVTIRDLIDFGRA